MGKGHEDFSVICLSVPCQWESFIKSDLQKDEPSTILNFNVPLLRLGMKLASQRNCTARCPSVPNIPAYSMLAKNHFMLFYYNNMKTKTHSDMHNNDIHIQTKEIIALLIVTT